MNRVTVRGVSKNPHTNAQRSMHSKRFVFAGSDVLNGKQMCVDQKYICKTFFCIWIFHIYMKRNTFVYALKNICVDPEIQV